MQPLNEKNIMEKLVKKFTFFLVGFTLLFSSCIPLKDYVYLQGDSLSDFDADIIQHKPYRIQPNDNLYIQIISNDDLSMYFNLSTTDRYLNNDAAIEISSYKVDSNGKIDFPHIGTMHVAGLTTKQIKDSISVGISELLVQYSVVVKLVNRSVSLLGEFNNPGTYSFYKDRMTIFEAIGLGKDLTDFGNRKYVKVIRHTNNEKTISNIDLTSTDIFKSEFYYILPNDIIYVEPTNKVYGAKTLPFTAILTSVNTAVLLYNAVNNSISRNNQ
jgi:polysaccharide export outer membrane protein